MPQPGVPPPTSSGIERPLLDCLLTACKRSNAEAVTSDELIEHVAGCQPGGSSANFTSLSDTPCAALALLPCDSMLSLSVGVLLLLFMVLTGLIAFARLQHSAASKGFPQGRRKPAGRRGAPAATAIPGASRRYIPFNPDKSEDCLFVDCTHPSALTFTHHKGHRNPPDVPPSDTSTGQCPDASRQRGWAQKEEPAG